MIEKTIKQKKKLALDVIKNSTYNTSWFIKGCKIPKKKKVCDFDDPFKVSYLDGNKWIEITKIPDTFRWCGGTWQIIFDRKEINPPLKNH